MPQTRFHRTAGRAELETLSRRIEPLIEEDGHPLALIEIDEDRDLFELSIYVEDDTAPVEAVLAGLDAPPFEREILPDIDWVAKSLHDLKPVRAGRILVHGSHDRARRRIGDIAIEIEAGLAFGTGHHGTTLGCLEMLDRVIRARRPRNALDLGTGSAVLAIAIARLAHIPVLATDIDPVATRVAAENCRLNGVSSYVAVKTATGFQHPVFRSAGPFDLIVANILTRPLMRLAPRMAEHIAPGGSLVLSGILDRQRDAVVAAYGGQRFRHVRTTSREGWVTILMSR